MGIIWRGKKLTPEQLEAVLPVLKKHQNKPWTKLLSRNYNCSLCTCQKTCDTQDEWCLKMSDDLNAFDQGKQAFASDMDRALCD